MKATHRIPGVARQFARGQVLRISSGDGIDGPSDGDRFQIFPIFGCGFQQLGISEALVSDLKDDEVCVSESSTHPRTEGIKKSLSKSVFCGLSKTGAATWTT